MIDHAFKPHEVWKTRDMCEQRLDDPNDENIYGICAARRSEHMDEVQGLRIQFATALRERDEARALAEKWVRREAAGVERGIRADADALSEIQGLQEALAAARLEIESLKTALAAALDGK